MSHIEHNICGVDENAHFISFVINCKNLFEKHLHVTLNIPSNNKPHSYNDVVKHCEWQEAMRKEIQALQSNVDYSLFTKRNFNSFTALLVYVDDKILIGNSLSDIHFT